MKIYNTLTKKKEDFTPLIPDEINMYACGITPYDHIHMGHARQAIVYDVIRTYFEFLGYKVTYVRNFTDIDDKIINRAHNEGKNYKDISNYFIEESKRDLKLLKVREATFEPRVTDCTDDIISFIQTLINKKYAYIVDGEVLFDVSKFEKYGKLSNRKKDEMINADDGNNKRNKNDFVLWKPRKNNEPFWTSPWSDGRPGWHIECSAIIHKYFGNTIDIHGGGVDLVFPHHENEIAQSEAYSGETFVNYWIHNGLVAIDGSKMSKSQGNFITVKELLHSYFPEEIRFSILSHSIESEINFSKDLFLNARKRLFYFYNTLNKIFSILKEKEGDIKTEISKDIFEIKQIFIQNMNDNFNTSKVIAEIGDIFKDLNIIITSEDYKIGEKKYIFKKFLNEFRIIASVLRLFEEEPKNYLQKLRLLFLKSVELTENQIKSKIKERQLAKSSKNWVVADQIKNELLINGIILQDLGGITKWDIAL